MGIPHNLLNEMVHLITQNIWAATCDFQQCGISTSAASDEPVKPPLKLSNSKWFSVYSLTFIEYFSDQQRLWSGCAYAQADLRLCWSHIPHCCKSHVVAQLWFKQMDKKIYTYMYTSAYFGPGTKLPHKWFCDMRRSPAKVTILRQLKDSDQSAHLHNLIRVNDGHSMDSQRLNNISGGKLKPLSNFVNAQTDLNLRWRHMPTCFCLIRFFTFHQQSFI